MLWLSHFIFISTLFITPSSCFSNKFYQDFIHYSYYSKLADCISKDRLFEKPLGKGGCDISFCESKKVSGSHIVKIYEAPSDETGSGFIALDTLNKEVVISFRGSTTWADWLSDLQIVFTDYKPLSKPLVDDIPPCEDCKVHLGFYKDLRSIMDNIYKVVEDLFNQYPQFRLVLTGHSLGGALATLLAVEFRMKGFKPLIYTYGSPKIFNKPMARWMNDIFNSKKAYKLISDEAYVDWGIFRIVHDEDYVVLLPPLFEQAGVEFMITKKCLPHLLKDVKLIGVKDVGTSSSNTGKRRDKILDYLNAYEHRHYFTSIHKCSE